MSTVTRRIRGSMQFQKMNADSPLRVRESGMNRARMTCSDRLRQPNGQDWSGSVGMSPSGRFQVVETPVRTPWISREGIRMDAAKRILIAFALILASLLLVQMAAIGTSASQIRRLDKDIKLKEEKKEQLEAEIAAASGELSVCTEAVKFDLISSNGAKPIMLTVPQSAEVTFVRTEGAVRQEEPDVRASTD